MSHTSIHSYHIFLFPFKWNYQDSTDKPIEEKDVGVRINIDKFEELLLDSGLWDSKIFSIENVQDYNEWAYFYDFSRNTLFPRKDDKVVKQYNCKEVGQAFDSEYIINLHGSKNKTYTLKIDKVQLDCYDTGIAIMAFYLANFDNSTTPQDILNINDFGRRIYPQFLKFPDDDKTKDKYDLTLETKKAFLANKISIQSNSTSRVDFFESVPTSILADDDGYDEDMASKRIIAEERFNRHTYEKNGFDLWKEHINNIPIEIALFIRSLLGDGFTQNKTVSEKIFIEPVIDDRMFVLCWLGNSDLMRQLRFCSTLNNTYGYESGDFWHKFICIDNSSPSCLNQDFKKEYIRKSTIPRWLEGRKGFPQGNTLYGITRYSFMIATDSSEFSKDFLLVHLQTVYAKLIALTLVQRASILQFSKEAITLAEMAKEVTNKENSKAEETLQKISNLYLKYLQFINKIHFREVTAQEQGIEIYDKLHELMRIDQNVKDLEGEIKGLLNYAELEENKKRTKIEIDRKRAEEAVKDVEVLKAQRFNDITVGLASVSIPSLIVGYYGMNTFNPKLVEFEAEKHWLFIIFLIVSPILLFLVFTDRIPKVNDFIKASRTKIIGSILMFLCVLLALAYPIFKSETKDKRTTSKDTLTTYSPQTDSLKFEIKAMKREVRSLKDSLLKQQYEQQKLLKKIERKLK